jgi:hypothetical protein
MPLENCVIAADIARLESGLSHLGSLASSFTRARRSSSAILFASAAAFRESATVCSTFSTRKSASGLAASCRLLLDSQSAKVKSNVAMAAIASQHIYAKKMFLCVREANSSADGLDEFDAALITAIATCTIGSRIVFWLAIRGERKAKVSQSVRRVTKRDR